MRKQKTKSDIFTKEELKKILSLPDKRSKQGFRDYVILMILSYTGIKKRELAKLKIDNVIDFENTKSILIKSKKMGKVFSKYADQMDDRYGKACRMVDWLVESIEKVKEEFESSDADDLQKYIRFIKLAPTVIATSREILNQLDFIKREQERIKVQQTNSRSRQEVGWKHIQPNSI